MTKSVYVTRPNSPDRDKLYAYLDGVLDRRLFTNEGPLVQELTKRLESFLGVKNLLLVSSGTMALDVANKVSGVGSEVYTTPFSFPATSSILCWRGTKPRYVDISYDSFNLDENLLDQALGSKECAVLATHVFGNPCHVEAFDKLAKDYSVPLVYDAAHAFGTEVGNQSILNFGDVSILSFHATKVFNTLEGGALVIRDDERYESAKRLINFGLGNQGVPIEVGLNGKMNEFQAAVGLCLLDDIDQILRALEENRAIYDLYLSNELKRQIIHPECGGTNNGYVPICFPTTEALLRAVTKLEEFGVYGRRYFYPSLDTVAVYGGQANCSVSQDIASRVFCLPTYVGLAQEKIEEICFHVNAALEVS